MRIMSDKTITKDEVWAAISDAAVEIEAKCEKRAKVLMYVTLASCWVSISTLVYVLFK